MPLLQDVKKIAELREKYPYLTHTSSIQLDKIEPNENVDAYETHLGKIVCATSDDSSRDFYALRAIRQINHAYGNKPRIFIFEQINKDEPYFEHIVSSENFTPIVSTKDGSNDDGFRGEWVCRGKPVIPKKCNRGIKGDVLKRTNALVFTIAKGKKKEYLERGIKGNPYVELKELLQKGILISENPDKLLYVVSELVHDGKMDKRNLQEVKDVLEPLGLLKRLSKGMEQGKNWLKKVLSIISMSIKVKSGK